MVEKPRLKALYHQIQSVGIHLNQSGCVLYSDENSLAEFNGVYVLGVNPGGDGEDPGLETLAESMEFINTREGENYNSFFDDNWRGRGPGVEPLQRRMTRLLGALLLPNNEVVTKHDSDEVHIALQQNGLLRRTLCTNLIFYRTRNEGGIPEEDVWEDQCWPVHEYLIRQHQPTVILCFGSRPYHYILSEPNRQVLSKGYGMAGHGVFKWRVAKLRLFGYECVILSVPHLSKYDVDKLVDTGFYQHPLVQTAISALAKRNNVN